MFDFTAQILDHVQATVSGVSAVSGWNIHRDDYVSFSADSLPAVVVYPHQDKRDSDEDLDNGREARTLTLMVEIRMVGHPVSTTTLPTAQAIAHALQLDRRMPGLRSTAGQVLNTRIASLAFEGLKSDQDYARAGLTVEVSYRTKG